jgi:hypothetical protein
MSIRSFSTPLIACAILCGGALLSHASPRLLKSYSNVIPDSGMPASQPGSAPAISPVTRFSPNYASDLLNLRRWQKTDLAVSVLAPDSGGTTTASDYATAVRDGAALWGPHLAGVLSVRFSDDPAQADIRIVFVDHGTLPDGAIGRTEVTYRNRDNVIVGALMRIDRTLKPELLSQVCAHEFGHAFGMEGHSVEKTDLMYARAHLPAAITPRDENTLHLNYSLQAVRADSKPAAQIGAGTVASTNNGTRTETACCLPEDDFK